MARMSPESHLTRIQQYFSFIGGIAETTIKEQNTELQSKITALDVQYQRLMEQVEQQSSLLEAELQRNEKL